MGDLPGFPGFFVAGIFSGALSTVSGGLNSLAAVTLEDFILLFHKGEISDKKATKITKFLAFAYGILKMCHFFIHWSFFKAFS
jgi:sodium-coupled monocarboxylate transporter 8/12